MVSPQKKTLSKGPQLHGAEVQIQPGRATGLHPAAVWRKMGGRRPASQGRNLVVEGKRKETKWETKWVKETKGHTMDIYFLLVV